MAVLLDQYRAARAYQQAEQDKDLMLVWLLICQWEDTGLDL
jgi:hypothetical protein